MKVPARLTRDYAMSSPSDPHSYARRVKPFEFGGPRVGRTSDPNTPSPLPLPEGEGGRPLIPRHVLSSRATSPLSLRERAGVRAYRNREPRRIGLHHPACG